MSKFHCVVGLRAKLAKVLLVVVPALLVSELLVGCAQFDRTQIRAGDRIFGPAVSVTVPAVPRDLMSDSDRHAWFASDYGSGNRMKLVLLNSDDLFSVEVAINRGPQRGMYRSVSEHLVVVESRRRPISIPDQVEVLAYDVSADPSYGALCVRYRSKLKDWRGRNRAGPALVEDVGLVCEHPKLSNVLVELRVTHRYETFSSEIELAPLADQVFRSAEYYDTL